MAPWPARHNGISIRYYPIIEALSQRHDIDLFVHSETRDEVPDDPVTQGLRRVRLQSKNQHPPAIGDRIATLSEALSPFGQPYKFARYHADEVLRQLREFIDGQRYDSVLWVLNEYRRLLARLKPDLHGARTLYDSIDSPYLHHLREPAPHGAARLWRTYDLWKTRRWERTLLTGVDAAAYISKPDAQASMNGVPPRSKSFPTASISPGNHRPPRAPHRGHQLDSSATWAMRRMYRVRCDCIAASSCR